MTSDLEYLLLKEKGPYHEVYVRRRLDTNPGLCKFYAIVISVISICLVLLLFSLVYVFVLVPSWEGEVLSWDGRTEQEARIHVLTHTHCGLVEGVVEEGVYVFKGIPYAEPPVGSQRWKEPVKMDPEQRTCWRDIFQAKKFGSSCMQPKGLHNFSSVVGSEDCLFLNVWTQSLDPLANKPIIFWIHGGEFVFGSGNSPPMSPTPEVTKSTHAVYVSFNYRLGPFGFLAMDSKNVTSSGRISGNYGLMDTVLALEWVQDNIRNFGGNPNKVTVLGQGAGATLIQALLSSFSFSSSSSSSRPSQTLFHRAWLASPSQGLISNTNPTSNPDHPHNSFAHTFLRLAECSENSCLKSLSSQEVMEATPWRNLTSLFWSVGRGFGTAGRGDRGGLGVGGRGGGGLGLVMDGTLLKEMPLEAWKHGTGHEVPTVLSTTAQEADLLPFDPTLSSWTWQHYRATVMEQLTSLLPTSSSSSSKKQTSLTALELYPPDSTFTPEFQYTSMLSDIRMTCPVQRLADMAARKFRFPVYRAVVIASPSSPVNLLNVSQARFAFHGWDLLAFFGDFEAFRFQPTEKDLQFQKVMREQVLSFARDGRPEAPVWDNVRKCTALLSDHVFPVERYRPACCEFWSKHGFLL